MTTVDVLIEEMKKTKLDNPTLEIVDILQIFMIDAIKNLSKVIIRSR